MGGKIFNGVRLGRASYERLSKQLHSALPYGDVLRSISSKETFGDLDFLILKETAYSDQDFVTRILESNQIGKVEGYHVNGDITSYGVVLPEGLFQLDFIGVPSDSYVFAYDYHGNGDIGNMLGRVARACGVKLGYNGLFYMQRSPDNDNILLREHLLTRDWDTALEFLGYEPEEFGSFDSLEEVFQYVLSSPFYDFNKLDLSQRNYKARVRDSKRPNYNAFLEYVHQRPKEVQEKNTLERTFEWFPDFEKEYKESLRQHVLHLEYKKKYNGTIIGRITGLEGKDLGEFKSTISPFFTQETVLPASQDVIEVIIEALYNVWIKQRLGENG